MAAATISHDDLDDLEFIDEGEVEDQKPSLVSMATSTSLNSRGSNQSDNAVEDMELDPQCENDSGVFSKDFEECDKRGVFHYVPNYSVKFNSKSDTDYAVKSYKGSSSSSTTISSSRNNARRNHNQLGDEIFSADSNVSLNKDSDSCGSSSSPPRNTSTPNSATTKASSALSKTNHKDHCIVDMGGAEGVEMKTYSTNVNNQDCDIDSDNVGGAPGSSSGSGSNSLHMFSSSTSSCESRFPRLSSSANSNRTEKGVDESIPFLSSSLSSENNHRGRHKSSSPPFGDPVDIKRVGASMDQLMEDIGKKDVPNLPASDPVAGQQGKGEEDGDKQNENGGEAAKKGKKKRKKSTKDENGGDASGKSKSTESGSCDVNGNPLGLSSKSRLSGKGLDAILPQNMGPSRSVLPQNNTEFDNYTLNGNRIGQMSDIKVDHDRKSESEKRKARKNKKNINFDAKDIPGNRGDERVEVLLDFIESNSTKIKKKSKVPNGPQTNLESKNNKKVKEKKKEKGSASSKEVEKISAASDQGSEKAEEQSGKAGSESGDKIQDTASESSVTSDTPSSRANQNAVEISVGNVFADSDETLQRTHDTNINSYIFTDIPDTLHQIEPKFTVVVKKKKQRVVEPVKPKRPYNNNREQPFMREDRRRPMRSITPPPAPTIQSDFVPINRAPSPSAFPVLGGLREGRRNSTGNTQTDTALDDSDLESVKSLPLGVDRTVDHTLSPGVVRPLYANIVASPGAQKAKPDRSSAGSTESTTNPERRHSTGDQMERVSSQDEVQQETRHSQEFPMDPHSRATPSQTNIEVKAKRKLGTEFDNSAPKDSVEVEDDTGYTPDTELPAPKEVEKTSTGNAAAAPPAPAVAPPCHNNTRKPQVSSTGDEPTTTLSNNVIKSVPITKPSNNIKKMKVKPVIFSDKKVYEPSKDLGISFGFDFADLSAVSPCDNGAVGSLGQQTCNYTNTNTSSDILSSSKPSQLLEGDVQNPSSSGGVIDPKLMLGINGVNPQGAMMQAIAKAAARLPENADNASPTPTPAPSSVAPSTAPTHHASPITQSLPPMAANVHDLQFTFTPESSPDIGASSSERENTPPGEQEENHPIRKRTPHPAEFEPGKFNVVEAVNFLMTEWDRVIDLREKRSGSVLMYE